MSFLYQKRRLGKFPMGTHLSNPLRWSKQEFITIVAIGWSFTSDNEHSVTKLIGTRKPITFDIPVASAGIDFVMTKMIFWSWWVHHMRKNDSFGVTFSCQQNWVGLSSAPISIAASILAVATRTSGLTSLMIVPTCRLTIIGTPRIGITACIPRPAAKLLQALPVLKVGIILAQFCCSLNSAPFLTVRKMQK